MINWKDISTKNKISGTIKTTCPNCSEGRKKKNDPCLSVNLDKGLAKCWHCENISIRDFKESHKKYDLPDQQWRNYTGLSDNIVKWFKSRGISQKTLIETKITEEKYYQPAKQKEMTNIVFNYFEGDVLRNKKYRSSAKDFTQSKNAKKIFYGINDVIGAEECYIVEGEMDKLSMWEIGIKNVISVPNGAKDSSDYFENCEDYLQSIKKFYIAVDMDGPGLSLEQNLIKRLGKYRCVRVNFKNKDANEDLMESPLLLEEGLKNLTEYPIDGTYTAKDIEEDIYNLYDNGYDETLNAGPAFRGMNEVFSLVRGQLTTVTGIPQHGKSNFIEWYVLNMIKSHDLKASFFSPEHFPMAMHQSTFIEKTIGKPFMYSKNHDRLKRDEIKDYNEWSKTRIYLTIPEKAEIPTWDWLFSKFEEQIYRYGIDLFIIDAFNKVKMKDGSLFEINQVLARLTFFCQMHSVNVFLIAHPTKMKMDDQTGKYKIPSLYDVKGSGDFYDQSHNGITVYREYDVEDPHTRVVITKAKYRFQGEQGAEQKFKYNSANGRFYEYGEHPDNFSWFTDLEELKLKAFEDTSDYNGYDPEAGF